MALRRISGSGRAVGRPVGRPVGRAVGHPVGHPVGRAVGRPVGRAVAPLLVAASLCAALAGCGGDEGPAATSDAAVATDATDSGGARASWAQGYSIKLRFHGGEADGIELDLDRDLYEIPTAFSFGSTHYTKGEVGFAMADTFSVPLPNAAGRKVPWQLEIGLNFGLVIGSDVNPVHTDAAGSYPFSCKPPNVRIFFETLRYESTCDGLAGEIVVDSYANVTGGRMAGTFKGKLQAVFPNASPGSMCDASANAAICKKPEIWAEVEGHYGFTLPAKSDGGG